ncbi:hypothetical protein MUU72_00415 [Streptomyces sp. RS10V-4]|uniref:hypothetical protein n=1 Tax=Streptomyces rhizoryzae TaxID=2932493 RepID=UPI002003BB22|nr:hypothetical protein [Streptomyces rhizoryzae]MCK7621614.1 hypothetical protein [Streptomyces rhizoryzae]
MANFDRVRINQLSDQGLAWFAEVLRVIETLDINAYVALMAPDVRLVAASKATASTTPCSASPGCTTSPSPDRSSGPRYG